MISYVLFYSLLVLSAFALLHALRKRDGALQFQALFAAAFLFSVVPQLVNHVFYPGRLPRVVYDNYGVEWAIVICILCLLAGWMGYSLPIRRTGFVPKLLDKMPSVPTNTFFWIGTACYGIGFIGAYKLATLAGGFEQQFMGGGHYALEWSGAPVVYIYIMKLLYPGLILAFLSVLRKGSLLKWLIVIGMFVYPVFIIIFLGRRSVTFSIGLYVFLCLWFEKKWTLPRSAFIGLFALAGLIVIAAPYWRSQANMTGDVLGAIQTVNIKTATDNYFVGEKGEGMNNLVIGSAARFSQFEFNYGAVFWNALIDIFVPAQFTSREFKDSLFVKVKDDGAIFNEFCGVDVVYGSYMTGPYSVFSEFSLVGAVFFMFFARFFKMLWHYTSSNNHLLPRMLYSVFAFNIAFSVVSSAPVIVSRMVLEILIIIIFIIFPSFLLSAKKRIMKQTKLQPLVSQKYFRIPKSRLK